uniref:Uncharacterized protein n=1 Tax=Aureoumbra lagunensis TaxID=44058 RepID=A0A7S3JRT5_9STRA
MEESNREDGRGKKRRKLAERDCRLVENNEEADGLIVFVNPLDEKEYRQVFINLPKDGRPLTLGRPHTPNDLEPDNFVAICSESNRKISRKLASLIRVFGSRRIMLTRNRNTVTSIFVDGMNYKAGEPAILQNDFSAIRFGATANKQNEVHAYFCLPIRTTTFSQTIFQFPQYPLNSDFAPPTAFDLNVPTLQQLAANIATKYLPLLTTNLKREKLTKLNDALTAARCVYKQIDNTCTKDKLHAEISWLEARRQALGADIRCHLVRAEARARYIINCGVEPTDNDLAIAFEFQSQLESGILFKQATPRNGNRRGELGTIACPSCKSMLVPNGRKNRHDANNAFDYGIFVQLVCEMNHDCALRGLPFYGTGLRLCHSAEMRLVLGDGSPRRLVSKQGELPSGFCQAERDVYKPGNCAAVFVHSLIAHDPSFYTSRGCKSCPAHFQALFCHDCVDIRPRRREGLFCCSTQCASGPACCLDPDRYLTSHIFSQNVENKQNIPVIKATNEQFQHDDVDHDAPNTQPLSPQSLLESPVSTPTSSSPVSPTSSIKQQHRRRFTSVHSMRSKAERQSLLGPCGLCGMLFCRRCLHHSRICCKTCYHATDFDVSVSVSDEEAEY